VSVRSVGDHAFDVTDTAYRRWSHRCSWCPRGSRSRAGPMLLTEPARVQPAVQSSAPKAPTKPASSRRESPVGVTALTWPPLCETLRRAVEVGLDRTVVVTVVHRGAVEGRTGKGQVRTELVAGRAVHAQAGVGAGDDTVPEHDRRCRDAGGSNALAGIAEEAEVGDRRHGDRRGALVTLAVVRLDDSYPPNQSARRRHTAGSRSSRQSSPGNRRRCR
jgi:hypothetical protein